MALCVCFNIYSAKKKKRRNPEGYLIRKALKIYIVRLIHSLIYLSEFPDKYLLNIYVYVCVGYQVQLFVTPWTVVFQAPLSMEFSSQKYWNRFPFPTPGDLLDSGIKPMSLASPALARGFFITCHMGNY